MFSKNNKRSIIRPPKGLKRIGRNNEVVSLSSWVTKQNWTTGIWIRGLNNEVVVNEGDL